jgi:hypothetical protein
MNPFPVRIKTLRSQVLRKRWNNIFEKWEHGKAPVFLNDLQSVCPITMNTIHRHLTISSRALRIYTFQLTPPKCFLAVFSL